MVPRNLTLDAGALIAGEKGDRQFWAIWKVAIAARARITVPAPVLCQVWRGNNPNVARVLRASRIEVLDEQAAKRAGLLLAEAQRSDVVDAAVVAGAIARNDAIVTSDPSDINHLLSCSSARREGERDGKRVLVFAV